VRHSGAEKHAGVDLEIHDLGVVYRVDAERLGGEVERVQHRPTAAEEERVGPPEAERAAERGLEADPLLGDPAEHFLRLADHVPGERLVGLAAGHPEQIVPEFLLGIGPVSVSVALSWAQRMLRVCRELPPR